MITALAPTLIATDRCDRCGAQAYVLVKLTTGSELLFCAHHGREHLPKMQSNPRVSEIIDERNRLQEISDSADVR